MAIKHIDTDELKGMLRNNPQLQLVDVRTEAEYYGLGHIPQARLIPMVQLPFELGSLDREQALVVICQHGIRSVSACAFLEANGFQHLYNVADGMAQWDGDLVFQSEVGPDEDPDVKLEGVSVK